MHLPYGKIRRDIMRWKRDNLNNPLTPPPKDNAPRDNVMKVGAWRGISWRRSCSFKGKDKIDP